MDPHHPAGRNGDKLYDFFLVCRYLHIWIHENPVEAKEKGLLYD